MTDLFFHQRGTGVPFHTELERDIRSATDVEVVTPWLTKCELTEAMLEQAEAGFRIRVATSVDDGITCSATLLRLFNAGVEVLIWEGSGLMHAKVYACAGNGVDHLWIGSNNATSGSKKANLETVVRLPLHEDRCEWLLGLWDHVESNSGIANLRFLNAYAEKQATLAPTPASAVSDYASKQFKALLTRRRRSFSENTPRQFIYGHRRHRRWEDAVSFGYLAAGGVTSKKGKSRSDFLLSLEPGEMVFVKLEGEGVPARSYGGVAQVLELGVPVHSFMVESEGQRLPVLELLQRDRSVNSHHRNDGADKVDFLARVEWLAVVDIDSLYTLKNPKAKPPRNILGRSSDPEIAEEVFAHFKVDLPSRKLNDHKD